MKIRRNRYFRQYFYDGRTALYHAFHRFGLISGDFVLMPANSCSALLIPILKLGLKVVYYDINRELTVNFESVHNALSSHHLIKAAVFVNQFGFSTETEQFKQICDSYNVFMVEDCCLTFPRNDKSKVGQFGHVAIYSVKKIFALPDGGILQINDSDLFKKRHERLSRSFKCEIHALIFFVKEIVKYFASNFEFIGRKILARKRFRIESVISNRDEIDLNYNNFHRPMTLVSRILWSFIDCESVFLSNSINFTKVSSFAQNLPLKIEIPVSKCLEDAIPYIFPLYTSQRNVQLFNLWRNGIFAEPAFNDTTDVDGVTNSQYVNRRRLATNAENFIGLMVHSSDEWFYTKVKEALIGEPST